MAPDRILFEAQMDDVIDDTEGVEYVHAKKYNVVLEEANELLFDNSLVVEDDEEAFLKEMKQSFRTSFGPGGYFVHREDEVVILVVTYVRKRVLVHVFV